MGEAKPSLFEHKTEHLKLVSISLIAKGLLWAPNCQNDIKIRNVQTSPSSMFAKKEQLFM